MAGSNAAIAVQVDAPVNSTACARDLLEDVAHLQWAQGSREVASDFGGAIGNRKGRAAVGAPKSLASITDFG